MLHIFAVTPYHGSYLHAFWRASRYGWQFALSCETHWNCCSCTKVGCMNHVKKAVKSRSPPNYGRAQRRFSPHGTHPPCTVFKDRCQICRYHPCTTRCNDICDRFDHCSTMTITSEWSNWPKNSKRPSRQNCKSIWCWRAGGQPTTSPIGGRNTSTCAAVHHWWSTATSTASMHFSSKIQPNNRPALPWPSISCYSSVGWSRDKNFNR